MNAVMWFFQIALLATFGWCVLRAAREAHQRWKVEDRIEQIGVDQVHGVVERLTTHEVFERRAARRV